MDWAETIARQDENHCVLGIGVTYITVFKINGRLVAPGEQKLGWTSKI